MKDTANAEQNAGQTMALFGCALRDVHDEISKNSLPKLRDQLGQLVNAQSTFSQKSKAILNDVRTAFRNWEQNCSQIHTKSDSNYVANAFQLGERLDTEYQKVIQMLSDYQKQITVEIATIEATMSKILKSEDSIIQTLAQRFCTGFQFLPTIQVTQRTILSEQLVSSYSDKIESTFFEIQNCFGPSIIQEEEMAISDWKSDQQFYARVWENYSPQNPEEIELVQGELVSVQSSPLHGHWFVKRANSQTGYAPSSILEPVE